MISALKRVFCSALWATRVVLVTVGFLSFLNWTKKTMLHDCSLRLSLSSVASLLTTTPLSSRFCRPLAAVIVAVLVALLHAPARPWGRRDQSNKAHHRGLELLRRTPPSLRTYDNDSKPENSLVTRLSEEFSPLSINSNPSDADARGWQKTELVDVETIPPPGAAELVVVKHVSSELEKGDSFDHIGSEVCLIPPPPQSRSLFYEKKLIVCPTTDDDHPPLALSLPSETSQFLTSSYQKKSTSGLPSDPPPVLSPPAYGHPSHVEKQQPGGGDANARTKAPWSGNATPTRRILRHEPVALSSWKVVQSRRSYEPAPSYRSRDRENFSQDQEQQLFLLDEEVDIVDKGEEGGRQPEPASGWHGVEEIKEEKVVRVDDVHHPDSFEAKWMAISAGRALKKCETWDVPPPVPIVQASRRAMKKWETFSVPPLPPASEALRRAQKNQRDELQRRADAFILKIRHDMLLQRQKSAEERYLEMIHRGTM